MTKLTEEQIKILNLTPDLINEIASANKLAQGSLRTKVINRLKDSLKDKVRLTADPEEKEKLQKEMDEIISAAREYINEKVKTEGAGARNLTGAFKTNLKPLSELNIYVDGARMEEINLYNTEIEGKIEIRNPDPSLLEDERIKTLLEGKDVPEAFKNNFRKISRKLENMLEEGEYKEVKKFPIHEFLGAVDVSKKQNRLQVYNFWTSVGEKYETFEEAVFDFFLQVREVDWGEKVQSKFDKLYDSVDAEKLNLEYIVEFDIVNALSQSSHHKFFNIITALLAAEGELGGEAVEYIEGEKEEDLENRGDLNSQLLEDLSSAVAASSSTEGDTIDPREWEQRLTEEITWDDTSRALHNNFDPLLLYEYNKGEKLIALTDEAEKRLLDFFEDLIDEIDEGQGVTIDTTTDIERWMEEFEDTKLLEPDEIKTLALPISVLDNVDFAKIYPSKKKFKSIVHNKEIGVEQIETIKNFFSDLYRILSGDDFRMEVETRTGRGKGRGSKFDAREARGTDVAGLSGGAKIPISLNRGGSLRGELNEFKGALQKMMDAAIDYYFDPLYSGLLPIEIPKFSSSIGSKVMQSLSLDLGLETVMSSAYDTLFVGSESEIDTGDMRAIADFLENIFMPEIKIDDEIITDGEYAADALTNIFGKNTEERNNNYCAALIHHYMIEIEDISLEEENFNGKPIAKRAEKFHEQFKARKAFPIFALPHWLDMNQGLLTSKNRPASSKQQYERLKNIFESVQTDLPVLLHKLLKAHDAIRRQLGKDVIIGYLPLNDYGLDRAITKMQVDENIDLTSFEMEEIIKAIDSHDGISKEYGISSEQVYMIKALFR